MSGSRWTTEQARNWYRNAGRIRGFNFLPRTAVNSLDMFQPDTFDLKTIDQELGWAHAAGYNSARVFLHFLLWASDAHGFYSRFDQFLALAAKHQISCMPVLFCDCAFGDMEPALGKQREPVAGIHNSAWVPSPGFARADDRGAWPELARYVQEVLRRFAQDQRVLVWDLYNEPGNSKRGERSLPLLEACFAWAREANPSQPLTAGPWELFESGTHTLSNRMLELSDVITFHTYDKAADVRAKLRHLQTYQRPLICTEWLNRLSGNTVAAILPIFAELNVGWYQWGLVAGKTQTYMPWGSKAGDPMPKVWQHDVFHPDGRPFDAAEMETFKQFA